MSRERRRTNVTRLPLFKGGDTLDISSKRKPTFCRDAGETPWRIADGAYGVGIALQCFEHFGTADDQQRAGVNGEVQRQAFDELRRVARRVVVSLPWKWKNENKRHNGIDDAVIAKWFTPPDVRVIVGRRILMRWG